jgi:uncharacterized protein (TIGR02453 family)
MFGGMTGRGLEFLEENHLKNSKEWFNEHRDIYENDVMTPLKTLVAELGSFMRGIDSELETTPAVNKTISRINNDIRFSKDKTLYKRHLWICFKRRSKEKHDVTGFYFGMNPENYGTGIGLMPSKEFMTAFRESIKRSPAVFRNTISFYKENSRYSMCGGSYKKTIDPDVPEDLQMWSQLKEFHLRSEYKVDSVLLSPKILDFIKGEFNSITPLYRYLINIKEHRHYPL